MLSLEKHTMRTRPPVHEQFQQALNSLIISSLDCCTAPAIQPLQLIRTNALGFMPAHKIPAKLRDIYTSKSSRLKDS